MNRRVFYLLAGGAVLLCLAFAVGQLTAQRPRPEPPPAYPGSLVGRYLVIRIGDEGRTVYVLDTVTGELYRADLLRDAKRYSERPRMLPPRPPVERDKEARPPRDKLPRETEKAPPDKEER